MTHDDAALDPANPFAAPSALPFGLPDFAAIRTEHYLPAIRAGLAEQLAELDRIATDPDEPTVENYLEAWERSGRLAHRAVTAFYNQASADSTPELDAIEEELAPLLAAHHDAIYLDLRLFQRGGDLAARVERGEITLDAAQAWLMDTLKRDFVRAGVRLDEPAKERLRALNAEISSLEAQFGRTLLAEQNAASLFVEDAAELAGLPEDAIAAARQAAADRGHTSGHLLELQLPTQQEALSALENREVRRRLFEASVTRGGRGGEHDTRAIVLRLARLRAEHAQLLGFEHHADYVAQDSTAKTADAVEAMLARLAPAAAANARRDAAVLQESLEAETPGATLEPWDWEFVSERVRRERYELDDALLRPYLALDRVLRDGVFAAANRLYGISFTEREDLVGYHPDVRVFEVAEEDGTPLGLFLGDFFTRASKRGGAWMNNLVDQSHLLGEPPVVVNNLNIPKPPPGQPALLAWDEVITLFHEFGHALHGLFSDVRHPSQSGTEVPRDFVEYPSQVNEMWAWEPQILAAYAVHHATGEPMPAEWVERKLASRLWGEGQRTTEYLAAAILDQAWHRLTPEQVPDDVEQVEPFEAAALADAGIALDLVPPRYRTTYFNHSFGGGYSAAYYSYIWSEVLDADTVEWFGENGGLDRATGERFRRTLLGRGGSIDPMLAFGELRGREPRIEPLLVRRGLDVV
ncbi:MAG: M3 family metallopeptidase, partial [Actinomycetales bacterium]|nr:M3 family metallopeptidase [Actinomycetales bacterium]